MAKRKVSNRTDNVQARYEAALRDSKNKKKSSRAKPKKGKGNGGG